MCHKEVLILVLKTIVITLNDNEGYINVDPLLSRCLLSGGGGDY